MNRGHVPYSRIRNVPSICSMLLLLLPRLLLLLLLLLLFLPLLLLLLLFLLLHSSQSYRCRCRWSSTSMRTEGGSGNFTYITDTYMLSTVHVAVSAEANNLILNLTAGARVILNVTHIRSSNVQPVRLPCLRSKHMTEYLLRYYVGGAS